MDESLGPRGEMSGFDEAWDVDRVVSMLVGDTQRIWIYAERGYAIPQPVPHEVREAYRALVAAGHTTRLIA